MEKLLFFLVVDNCFFLLKVAEKREELVSFQNNKQNFAQANYGNEAIKTKSYNWKQSQFITDRRTQSIARAFQQALKNFYRWNFLVH